MKHELMSAIATIKGTKIATIVTETVVKLNGGKSNHMQGQVTKRTSGGNIILGANYARMMQKKYNLQGNGQVFCSSPAAWGERIKGTPFITHKGEIYAELIWLTPPSKSEYFLNGKPIAKEDIIGLPSKNSARNEEVVLRRVKLSSITGFKCGKIKIGM